MPKQISAFNFKPGIYRELTQKAAEGSWWDSDKVRFKYGKCEVIGGWTNVGVSAQTEQFHGVPRALRSWLDNDENRWMAAGTHQKLYVWNGAEYIDITPIATQATVSSVFNTSIGSPLIVASVSSHGRIVGDYIQFVSASTTFGGNVVLAQGVSAEYQITAVPNANTFIFSYGQNATATSTSTGQAFMTTYLPVGEQSNTQGTGWGMGPWGHASGWGSPASVSASPTQTLRTWSLDNWGEQLVANVRGGQTFYWQPAITNIQRATAITSAPLTANWALVSPEDRHLVLYGTIEEGTGDYNPLLVRWSDQENYNSWSALPTNTAGEFPLSGKGTQIQTAIRGRGEIVIFTDSDIFSQKYIGGKYTFGFYKLAGNCGIIGPNAGIEAAGRIYWMGNGRFYTYDGSVKPLRCDVLRFIFERLDFNQKEKVFCGSNAAFNEIIWFYQDIDSTNGDCNRYVIYNYVDDIWYIGSLDRSAWEDASIFPNPIGASPGHGLFYHEDGVNDDQQPMTSFVESAFFDAGDGDQIIFLDRVLPDFARPSGYPMEGTLQLYVRGRKYPHGPVITKGPYNIGANTKYVSVRMRAREISLRLESNTLNARWREGILRGQMNSDGRR